MIERAREWPRLDQCIPAPAGEYGSRTDSRITHAMSPAPDPIMGNRDRKLAPEIWRESKLLRFTGPGRKQLAPEIWHESKLLSFTGPGRKSSFQKFGTEFPGPVDMLVRPAGGASGHAPLTMTTRWAKSGPPCSPHSIPKSDSRDRLRNFR